MFKEEEIHTICAALRLMIDKGYMNKEIIQKLKQMAVLAEDYEFAQRVIEILK